MRYVTSKDEMNLKMNLICCSLFSSTTTVDIWPDTVGKEDCVKTSLGMAGIRGQGQNPACLERKEETLNARL